MAKLAEATVWVGCKHEFEDSEYALFKPKHDLGFMTFPNAARDVQVCRKCGAIRVKLEEKHEL